jgi:hypothetical protein
MAIVTATATGLGMPLVERNFISGTQRWRSEAHKVIV